MVRMAVSYFLDFEVEEKGRFFLFLYIQMADPNLDGERERYLISCMFVEGKKKRGLYGMNITVS